MPNLTEFPFGLNLFRLR